MASGTDGMGKQNEGHGYGVSKWIQVGGDMKKVHWPVAELRDAAKALLADEWRCTVDWGPYDERQTIKKRLQRAIRNTAQAQRQEFKANLRDIEP